ncbi:MAG: hypothetical protein LBH18_03725 [Spirochaetaceae bacterium]|jgi:hypothetical protein|nr:hypothetical protein [Spirochaetaceae bacterium]
MKKCLGLLRNSGYRNGGFGFTRAGGCLALASVFALTLLTACLGLKTEIDIKRNGSGTINMEYRIANEFFSMSTRSGNENSPPLSIGKKDFEQTFDRIKGMKMTSYSEKEDGDNRLFAIKAKFDNLEALAAFLDSQGRLAVVERQSQNGKNLFSISFDMDSKDVDPDLAPILPMIFEDYYMDFKIKFPSNCEVSYMNAEGEPLPDLPYGETTVSAKSVDFYSSMSDLFTAGSTSMMTISW